MKRSIYTSMICYIIKLNSKPKQILWIYFTIPDIMADLKRLTITYY